jgi:mono/diheme cytochrome c family protein
MRKREDYTRLIAVALVLSVGILVAFQVYLLREPGRIENVLAADKAEQVTRGQQLFAQNCATCHGENGEGDIGPALNSKKFLTSTEDGRIFSLISSGVPGTAMPSWSQAYGGPFTDEQINDLVGFIRSWEATAQDIAKPSPTADASQGQVIFASTCYACHGANGQGTDRAPALNSKALLDAFDNNWLRQTISDGRPAKGMPTWGNVLSPEQINNVVAYIRSWQATAPLIQTPSAGATSAATPTLAPTQAANATPTAEVARPSNGNLTPGPALNLTGNVTSGIQVFVQNCQKCHGPQGTGGVSNPGSTDGTVPPLNPIDSTIANSDPKVFAFNVDLFVEHGSTPDGPNPAQVMPAWGDQHKLSPQQIADVIAYVLSLNGSPSPIQSGPPAAPTAPPTVAPTPTTVAAAPTSAPASNVARPSNGNLTGGAALNLTGNAANGTQLYVQNCQKCHGPQGTGGVNNPGSSDGTIPPLNPIDDTIKNSNLKTFAYNIDLFVEHGSTPEGPSPVNVMPAWGDQHKLSPQQIADLIAYIISLNP